MRCPHEDVDRNARAKVEEKATAEVVFPDLEEGHETESPRLCLATKGAKNETIVARMGEGGIQTSPAPNHLCKVRDEDAVTVVVCCHESFDHVEDLQELQYTIHLQVPSKSRQRDL